MFYNQPRKAIEQAKVIASNKYRDCENTANTAP